MESYKKKGHTRKYQPPKKTNYRGSRRRTSKYTSPSPRRSGKDNPLGLYIHVPFCARKCDYCDFYSVAVRPELLSRYSRALERQLSETAETASKAVDTVYFGGGTPAMLGGNRLKALLRLINGAWQVDKEAEITIELNPDSTTPNLLKKLRRAGFNRVSIGWQSAVDTELAMLGRLHNSAQAAETVAAARKAGFRNISVDLMYGIEGQTIESLSESLRTMLAAAPDHISCYALKVEEGTKLWTRRNDTVMPDDDTLADMYELICKTLKDAGFTHYEISNFALPGKESRHNMKYWRLDPYIGFGPAAHSDYSGARYSNVRDVSAYINAIETGESAIDELEEIGQAERVSEYILLRLRTAEGIDPAGWRFTFPFAPVEKILTKYKAGGYTEFDGGWRLTEKGFFVSNTVISDILAEIDGYPV